MEDMGPIIDEFLAESYENLDQLDQDFVTLESDPKEDGLLARIFRSIHTLKGTCGFLGFSKLESVAHVGENLLSKLRDGELEVTPDTITALLAMGDAIRQMLSCIEQDGNEGDVDYSGLVDTLTRLQNGEPVSPESNGTSRTGEAEVEAASGAHPPPGVAEAASSSGLSTTPPGEPASSGGSGFDRLGGAEGVEQVVSRFYQTVLADPELESAFRNLDLAELVSNQITFLTGVLGGPVQPNGGGSVGARAPWAEPGLSESMKQALQSRFKQTLEKCAVPGELRETIMRAMNDTPSDTPREVAAVTPSATDSPAETPPVAASPSAPDAAATAPAGAPEKSGERRVTERRQGAESIRVDVHLLDRLMNLVGELVLARNQLVQYAAGEREPAFVTTIQHLNQLTSELQEGVMKTRMQPIGNIWDKFPRIVRDLSMSLGKKVRMEMEGKETELDKTLIEAIKDPLTHIVRNSVDHGIETPEVRQQRGKDPEGRLYLRAYHEGGQVNVEISDDGGGIDPQKLLRKAIEKNVITPQQGSRMSERELVNLIFAPGFSTAEKVSNISGRGVGMDVVKTNIEKIGGTVDIQSTLGQGTTLRVKIPLTLAIVPALVVTCEQNRYCIPQVSLLELVRLDPEQPNGQRIETIQGTPVVRLRGNLLPLVYLRDELELPRRNLDREVVNIVVLQADARQFGLVVDGICDTEEIVVKPLGKQLGSLNAYAGTTIMGDGKVALILDIMGLAQKAGLVSSQSNGQASVSKEDSEDTSGSEGERQTLLVFRVGEHLRMAIALSMVARLEEIPVQSIEQSGNQLVVQYRGEIMPLFYLSRFFGQQDSSGDRESIQVVVYTDRGRSVGLVVDHILDIIEETIQIQPSGHSQCVLGKAVIQGRVTELLDVESLIQALDSQEFQDALAPARAV